MDDENKQPNKVQMKHEHFKQSFVTKVFFE